MGFNLLIQNIAIHVKDKNKNIMKLMKPIEDSRIVEFEDKFMDYLDYSWSDIISNIKSSGELSDDDKSSLKDKIEGFVKGF